MHLTETFAHIVSMLIEDHYQGPLFIVFDDYQCIESQEIHEGIDLFLRYLPPHVHLIILTRVDPPLNLSALRVKDQVIHIQSEELHFNYDESAEFLRRNINTDLDEDTINDLYQKTEGWIAGLQLAALSLRNRKGPVALPFNEENRFIINYLMEQIYSKLSTSQREFLLRTAI